MQYDLVLQVEPDGRRVLVPDAPKTSRRELRRIERENALLSRLTKLRESRDSGLEKKLSKYQAWRLAAAETPQPLPVMELPVEVISLEEPVVVIPEQSTPVISDAAALDLIFQALVASIEDDATRLTNVS